MAGYVYLVEAIGTGLYKIGIASDLKDRFRALQTGCPYKLRLVHACQPTNPIAIEREFHVLFKRYRVIGEWFNLPLNEIKRLTTYMSLPLDTEESAREEVVKSLDVGDVNVKEPEPLTKEQIIELLLQGVSRSRIVKDYLGCKGVNYQKGLQMLNQILDGAV